MLVPWRTLGLLVAGGALGTIARVLVASLVARPVWPTLVVNVVGSFALGLFMAGALLPGRVGDAWRVAFAVAFLGAFTTMSAFAYDTVALAQQGRLGLAIANAVGNPLASVLSAAAGVAVGRAFA